MKKFFYKDGAEVQAGDICFYSEDDGTDRYHYANAIAMIESIEGKLYSRAVFFTQNNGYTLKSIYDEAVSLEHACIEKDGRNILESYTKIGTTEDSHLLNEDYINQHYARKKEAVG